MKSKTHILSISIGVHDSCITISSEKEILLHLEAERVFRTKHLRCTPDQMLHLVKIGLAYLNLHIGDVSELVMTADDRRTGKADAFLIGPAKDEVKILGRSFKPLFAGHHSSHIATCYPSGLSEALVVCADAGSWEGSTRFYHRSGDSIRDVANFADEVITGKFYGTITQLLVDPDILKAHVFYPGKTMGLAGWGEFSQKFYKLLDENRKELNRLHFEPVTNIRQIFDISDDYSRPWLDKDRRDLAFTAQKFWEDEFMKAIERYAHLSRNICIVGGCALNVLLNTRILRSSLFENVYIPPVSGDCGQSLGAILHFFPQVEVSYPFLGRGFGECEKVPPQIVDDLLEHKIVGWYQGRSEIGPRALGHRSFIGLPSSDAMRIKLSEQVKEREPYRPVAPTILEEDAESYFEIQNRSDFMTFAPLAKSSAKELAPAIVHRDGTSRVQTVSKESNPVLYAILDELSYKGRPPIVMNSSFNLREQAIVDTPDDALRAFMKSKADVFYINGERHAK